MKHLQKFGLVVLFIYSTTLLSQVPQSFKYQSVARDITGNIIANQPISFRISILKSSISGTAVYTETHTISTNAFGIANFEIGKGSVSIGSFSGINWHNDTYFIQTEMDALGGSNYTLMGTSQLLSVPYALHAATADSTIKGGQNLKVVGDTLFISKGNWVILPKSTNSFLIIDE
ncbi:MAG: hypothetical protein J0M08_05050 [Bacteroidetes bacterium]|nr:hypothetical protein [Bacteroidota bacterium]